MADSRNSTIPKGDLKEFFRLNTLKIVICICLFLVVFKSIGGMFGCSGITAGVIFLFPLVILSAFLLPLTAALPSFLYFFEDLLLFGSIALNCYLYGCLFWYIVRKYTQSTQFILFSILFVSLLFFSYTPCNTLQHRNQVSEEIKIEMIEKQQTSGEPLVLHEGRIVAKRGKELRTYLAIKNTMEETYCFAIRIRCYGSIGGSMLDICGSSSEDDIVGGYDVDDSQTWFWLYDEASIDGNSTEILPFFFQRKLDEDIYHMVIEVFIGDGPRACDGRTIDTLGDPYASHEFVLEFKG